MPLWFAALPGLLIPAWFWIAQLNSWPFWPAGLLLVPLAWRGAGAIRLPKVMLILLAALGSLAVLARNELPILFYPVVINAAFLMIFALSLKSGQPLVERLARLSEPDLPPEGVAYTRKVTQAWCIFFMVNGLIALWTTQQDRMVWGVYNGALSYLFTALMFACEWLIRQRVRGAWHE